MGKIPDFVSVQEAHDYKVQLLETLDRIEAQLADRNRTDQNGDRMSSVEYHDWRRRTIYAKRHTLGQLRLTKEWIRRAETDIHKAELASLGVDPADGIALLRGAATLFTRLQQEGVDFSDEETALLTSIKEYCRENANA